MLFSKSISIPADTTPASPLRVRVPICEGLVKQVWVRWRWGSGNLCGCRVLYEEFQLWPLSMTEWFVSSIEQTAFEENFVIDDVPTEFVVEAYNEDDTFAHTLWIAFSILREGRATTLSEFVEFLEMGSHLG